MKTIIQLDCGRTATLTTERPESSYGMPVLVIDDVAYGRADQLPTTEDNADFAGLFDNDDNTAAGWVRHDWRIRTHEISKLPVEEYNLIAKFIGLDLAHD